MANELQFESASLTGSTVYVVVWNEAGQAWNGSAFATYTTTRTTWDIAATEISGTGLWRADFPGAAGYRRWKWLLQAGGSPSHTADVELASGSGYWDGTTFDGAANADAGTLTDVNQDACGAAQIFKVVRTSAGLVGDQPKTIRVGSDQLYDIDFANVAAVNRQILTVDSVAIASGTEGGLTFGTPGRDKTKAKLQIIPVTAGTYTVNVAVTFLGGWSDSAVVTIKAVA